MLSQLGSMLSVTDKKGEVLYANPSVEKTVVYPVECLLGNRWWELTFDDPQEAQKVKKGIFENV